jgi:hypothetical protein
VSIVMVGSHGKNEEGVYTYSVNTTSRADIQVIIDGIIAAGAEFWETPEITFKHRTFHCLLRFYIPTGVKMPVHIP